MDLLSSLDLDVETCYISFLRMRAFSHLPSNRNDDAEMVMHDIACA